MPTVIVSEKKKPQKVVIDPEVTRNLAQLNERFAEIAKLWETKNLEAARGEYRKLLAMTDAPAHYRSYAHLRIAQSYAAEQNTAAAQTEYEKIKAQAEYPRVHRYEAEEILKEMDRVAKGLPRAMSWPRGRRSRRLASSQLSSSWRRPATMRIRARGNSRSRRWRKHGMRSAHSRPRERLPGPVGVRLLPGEYPMTRTLELTAADSGTETAPIVYRADKKGHRRALWRHAAERLDGGQRSRDPPTAA